MPTPTYVPMANLTLSASAASVTFSSISQAYRDLVLVMNFTAATGSSISMKFNNDSTSSAYSRIYAAGRGNATLESYAGASTSLGFSATPATGVLGNKIVNVFDYAVTDKHKSVLARENITHSNANPAVSMLAGRWANTSAITSIQLFASSNFDSGSTFALYGVSA